jgi:endonuclease-8
VHPFSPLDAIDEPARRALFETAHSMLRSNLDTPRRITYRGGLAVYGKAGRPCPRCRTPIAQAYGGDETRERTTFWCPTCQPAPLA